MLLFLLILPVRVLAEAAVTVIVKILNAVFKRGLILLRAEAEMCVPYKKQVWIHQRDQLNLSDHLIGRKLCADGILRFLKRLLTKIVVSTVGIVQRTEEQVDVLKRFFARKDRLAGIIQIFQAVDL